MPEFTPRICVEPEGATLNGIAGIYEVQGRYEEALIIFEEALAIFRDLGDRAGEGAALNGIALVYKAQGWYEEALATYEDALAIFDELGGWAGKRQALNGIALVYETQGRYEEALATFEAVLVISREVGDLSGEGTSLGNIALVYIDQGQYEIALSTYEESLAISREVGNRADEGDILNSIGWIYRSIGQYETALINFEHALAIFREVGGRAQEGNALNNIALAYKSQGQYEAALINFEQALAIFREVNDQAKEGIVLNNIATVYDVQGQYELALITFEEALVITRRIGNRPGVGITLNNIALIYWEQGRYNEAMDTYEDALAINRAVGDRNGEGTTLNNMGLVYWALGQYDEALTAYEEALAITQEVGDRDGEGNTLNNIAEVYESQEQYPEALTYYQLAIDTFETIRTTAGHDVARASFIARYAFLYSRALDLYIQENKFPEAFLVSEQGRARSFNDVLSTGSVQLTDNEAAPLIAVEQTTYNELNAIKDALARARALSPPDPELVVYLEVQLADAEHAHDNALTVIAARNDQLAALVPGRLAVSSLTEVQALLNSQTTLVSFWVLEERVIAFIITVDSFVVLAIDVSATDLNMQVKALHNFPETESSHPSTAVALYNTLFTPIQPYLNTPHLIIIPHQALHYVPFAALTDGVHYLIDEYAITYLPNASMLQYLPKGGMTPSYDTALIVGNPAVAADDFGNPLLPLPIAENTAVTIANLFDTEPLLGEMAGEMAISSQIHTANILHLGAHASFNTVAPLQSAIYLTPGEKGYVEDDGRLHVGEVYGLSMDKIELVVLSACQTNVGNLELGSNTVSNITAGDELVSLNRAFLFQSPTVISTLWTVDDAATSLLMEYFYAYLLAGNSKIDSLRFAQMVVRERYPNPYFWAGFILSGDGGEASSLSQPPELPEQNSAPRLLIWLIPLGILVVVAVYRTMQKRNPSFGK